MASSAFSIAGTTVPAEVSVAYSATVDLAVLSLTGIASITWSIEGSSDPSYTNPTITPAGVPLGATASLPQIADPGTGLGASFLVRCRITDTDGVISETHGVFGTLNRAGLLPVASGEKTARHATKGWIKALNYALAAPRVIASGTAVIDFGSITTLSSETATVTSAGTGMLITDHVDVWCATGTGDTRFDFTGDVKNTTDLYVNARNISAGTLDLASATYYYRVTR